MSIEELKQAEAEARARCQSYVVSEDQGDWGPAAMEKDLDAYAAAVRATLENEVEAEAEALLEAIHRLSIATARLPNPVEELVEVDHAHGEINVALAPFLARVREHHNRVNQCKVLCA